MAEWYIRAKHKVFSKFCKPAAYVLHVWAPAFLVHHNKVTIGASSGKHSYERDNGFKHSLT